MIIIIGILCVVCIEQTIYIHRTNIQLSEWLDYLKSVKKAPEQKSFVKTKGILSEINYALNDILEETRKQFITSAKSEEANKQILTNLSHDVRTPLASLTGCLEALTEGKIKPDEQAEYIHIAYRKALNLKELVDTLFEWFKISSNEQEYQLKEYDVNELTRQIIISFLPILEKENINLEVRIPEEEWLLFIDRIAYERILNNLLGNVLKHGKCSRLEVAICQRKNMVMIEITNDGVTIPKEEIHYIFDRLYKCDAARSEKGSGLGLAITRELVIAMKGEITAQSLQGKTSFYLTFPLCKKKVRFE